MNEDNPAVGGPAAKELDTGIACAAGIEKEQLLREFTRALARNNEGMVPFGLQVHLGDCLSCAKIWQAFEDEIAPQASEAPNAEEWNKERYRIFGVDPSDTEACVEKILYTIADYALQDLSRSLEVSLANSPCRDSVRCARRDLSALIEKLGTPPLDLTDHLLLPLDSKLLLSRLDSRHPLAYKLFVLGCFLQASIDSDELLISPTGDGDFELDIDGYRANSPLQLEATTRILIGRAA